MKKLLISVALGSMLVAGGVAVAQPNGPGPKMGMRGPMMADANKDGKLTKAEVTAASEAAFAKMDLNGDGKITKEERDTLRQKRFDDRFAKMDTDGNGQISKAEFRAQHDARQEKMAEWRAGKGGPDGQRMGRMHHRGKMGGMWGKDADKDGTVTRAEFMARPMAMFDRADANKDGTVTAEEMKAAMPGRGERGKGRMAPPPPPAPQN